MLQDEHVRRANEAEGWKLCEHCEGTGNELYWMYRSCSECGGSGVTGEPPIKVRLARWWRAKRQEARHFSPTARLRWALSYYLGIGEWFRDAKDPCRHCGALPSDVDFEVRRVGRRHTECWDSDMCRVMAEESSKALAELGSTDV